MQYIAIESATGTIYQVSAPNDDKAFRFLARDVLNMKHWNEKDFDTGNVDFDLYVIKELPEGKVQILQLVDEP